MMQTETPKEPLELVQADVMFWGGAPEGPYGTRHRDSVSFCKGHIPENRTSSKGGVTHIRGDSGYTVKDSNRSGKVREPASFSELLGLIGKLEDCATFSIPTVVFHHSPLISFFVKSFKYSHRNNTYPYTLTLPPLYS
jgi:hypothetical protein